MSGVEVSWETVTGAARYDLRVWTSADDWQQLDDGDLTATNYSHTELTAGTTYYYWLRALSDTGEAGEWSERESATVLSSSAVPDATGERTALVALYEATGGADWAKSDNWLSDEPIGTWYGVATDESDGVTQLDLSGKWVDVGRYRI